MGAENFAIGGMKNLENISGAENASNSIAFQTIPQNSDYGFGKANPINNQTQFLGLTAQRTTAFNSATLDFQFGTTPGINPYQVLQEHQGKQLHTFG